MELIREINRITATPTAVEVELACEWKQHFRNCQPSILRSKLSGQNYIGI